MSKSISLGSTVAAALIASMSTASMAVPDAVAAKNQTKSVPAPSIDTNNDGKPDAWDRNGDGKTDAWDRDGDGKPDVYDDNNDGQPDAPQPAGR